MIKRFPSLPPDRGSHLCYVFPFLLLLLPPAPVLTGGDEKRRGKAGLMRHFRHFPPFLKASSSSSSMLGMEKHNGWPLLPSSSSSHAWLKRFSTSEEGGEGGEAATLFSFSSPLFLAAQK